MSENLKNDLGGGNFCFEANKYFWHKRGKEEKIEDSENKRQEEIEKKRARENKKREK